MRVRRGEDISVDIEHLDHMVSLGEELMAVVSSKSLDFGPVWLSKLCLWLLAFGPLDIYKATTTTEEVPGLHIFFHQAQG